MREETRSIHSENIAGKAQTLAMGNRIFDALMENVSSGKPLTGFL
jgi:hypothetical protein